MRGAIVFFFMLAVISVGAPGGDEPGPVSGSGTPSWEGRHFDELLAAWGPPTKIKRKGKDRKVLVYRQRFFGDETVGATALGWDDAGIGPSPVPIGDEPRTSPPVHPAYELGSLRFGGSREIIATRKVRFHVNPSGIIDKAEFSPLKWKHKP